MRPFDFSPKKQDKIPEQSHTQSSGFLFKNIFKRDYEKYEGAARLFIWVVFPIVAMPWKYLFRTYILGKKML
jgi:hypothetical protein